MPEVQLANTGENPEALESGQAGSQPPLYLQLAISDPEVILAASEYPEGCLRSDFIQTGLKIGVLSLRAARGVVDGDSIRKGGDAVLAQHNERPNGCRTNLEQNLASSLSHCLDPKQGMFSERVERLVHGDGDLAGVMKGQVANTHQQCQCCQEDH